MTAWQASGWSAAELARRSGVSYDVINKLKQREKSSTNAESAAALARALSFDVGSSAPGFAETGPKTLAARSLDALDAPPAEETRPATSELKIGTDGKHVQIVATVDRAGLDRLIRRLEAMREVLDD